jgi:hypothetical protein
LVGGLWSGFTWLRMGIIGGLLWLRWWTFGFWRHGVSGINAVACIRFHTVVSVTRPNSNYSELPGIIK